jgi:hypothetical protein
MAEAGRPKIDVEKYFAKITPYLQLGYTLHKACVFSQTPYRQLHDYYEEQDDEGNYVNEDFRNRVEATQTQVSVQARRNLAEIIQNAEIKNEKGEIIRPKFGAGMVATVSQQWLESMEKEDFSKLLQTKDITEKDEGQELLKMVVLSIREDVRKERKTKKP